MRYRYFLFDLDGTLTDSGEGIMKSVQYALASFGIEEPDYKKLSAFIGPPLVESFHQYYGFDEEQSLKAQEKYRERYNTIGLWENRVYEGIPELLAALKAAGGTLLVATSKPEDLSRRILESFHLADYFDDIIGSVDGVRSTKTEVIEEVFRRADLTEEKLPFTIMIGDRRNDVIGAKNKGINSLGIYNEYADPGELEEAGATYVTHSAEEAKQILLR